MTIRLPMEDFKFVVKHTNLFALDLIINDSEDRILLGRRTNPPAKGFWFVPGGRVYKNEQLSEALCRILQQETGIDREYVTSIVFAGLYEHLYEENVFEDASFNTHYIIAACRIGLRDPAAVKHDAQHEGLRFVTVEELLASSDVHSFVKAYFEVDPPNRFL